MDVFTYIIMGILSLDTIRAIIAMTGWVKPDAKFSWIIYGRYERNLIETALRELGFSSSQSERIIKKIRNVSDEILNEKGVTSENVMKHLIALLAKYIVKFDANIQYGGQHATNSHFYIDTMEISHCEEDRCILCSAMVILIGNKTLNKIKPDVIITPKGGNSLMGMQVAKSYETCFIMAKSKTDKSRITTLGDTEAEFLINYEGAWGTKHLKGRKSIVVDCNTSGGTQLLEIVEGLGDISKSIKLDFDTPNEVYVLFRVDDSRDIDKRFSDRKCSLYRFFDLDEESKELLYKLKTKCKNENKDIDIYDKSVSDEIESIIKVIKNKNKIFYSK